MLPFFKSASPLRIPRLLPPPPELRRWSSIVAHRVPPWRPDAGGPEFAREEIRPQNPDEWPSQKRSRPNPQNEMGRFLQVDLDLATTPGSEPSRSRRPARRP